VRSADSPELDELCVVASSAAESRGHDLGDWEAPAGEAETARRAMCRRCGEVAYVRVEKGMTGLSGEALRKQCLPSKEPDPALS
jgi:hypothetical protein